jgi:hypothetical protein
VTLRDGLRNRRIELVRSGAVLRYSHVSISNLINFFGKNRLFIATFLDTPPDRTGSIRRYLAAQA